MTISKIIGHWKLDEASGSTAYDSTTNGNHGTITGTSVEKGLFDNSRVFYPGSEDRIEIPDASVLKFEDQDFTVTAWFKKGNEPSQPVSILSKWDGTSNNKAWRLIVDTDGTLKFQTSDDGTTASTDLSSPFMVTDNDWHLAAVTRTGPQFRLCIDGVVVHATVFGPSNIFSSTAPLVFGNQSDATSWDGALDGYIDNIRIYNYALEDLELNDLVYNTGYDAFPPYFYAVSPNEGEEVVSTSTDIVFRYVDENPNLDTLNVTFNGYLVMTAGVPEDGYFAYAEHVYDGYTDGYDGYEITIISESPLPERTQINVEIDAADAYGSFGAYSYDFWTASSYDPPPKFVNFDPVPGTLGLNPTDSLFFQFNDGYDVSVDLVSGVDLNTLRMRVNELPVIVNGIIQAGYSGSIVANEFDGVNVTITKDGGWPLGRSLNIALDGKDNNGTGKSFSYIVKVGGGPSIVNAVPIHDSISILRDAVVSFEFYDAIFGIDQEGLDVTINGATAVTNGIAVNGHAISYQERQDGYRAVMTHPLWPELEQITVYVEATNRVNELATHSYYFYTIDDQGPSIYPVVPSSGAERVAVNSDIVFNITDPGSGPDLTTLWYKLNGEYILQNSEPVNGYYVSIVPITDGYEIAIDKDSPFDDLTRFEGVVEIKDAHGNYNSLTYYFSSDDSTAPKIVNLLPEAGGFASGDDHITFSVHDSGGSGVLPQLISVSIDGTPAISSGSFQDGFSGSISASWVMDGYDAYGDGYDVVIVPDDYFEYGNRVSIDVEAKDAYGNVAELEYSFLIYDIDAPIISYLDPADGGIAPLRPYIRFKIWEPGGIGVDVSRLQMTVDDLPAIVDGQIAPRFSGAVEETTVDGGDGYNVWVRLDSRFESETVHYITIDGYDYLDHHAELSYTFTTTSDLTPPTFEAFSPEPDQIEVPRDTSIYFQFNDDDEAWNSNIQTLNVVVDGSDALIGGLPVNGYGALIEENDKDGYDVTLYPPDLFPESYWVLVELDGYDEADNQTSYAYMFRTFEQPGLTDFDPYDGQQRVPTDTLIKFNFTDASSSPDLDTLRVAVNDEVVVLNGIAQDSNAISAIPIEDGYRIEVELSDRLSEYSITNITIDGYDIDPEPRWDHAEYVFSTDDESSPVLTNVWPEDGATEVTPYTDVLFDLYDYYTGVDLSTLDVFVDDRTATLDGVAQDGWTLSTAPKTVDGYAGYSIYITTDRAFALDSDIGVHVSVEDAYGNHLDGYYSFRTYKDITAPEIVNLDPAPDTTEVPLNKDIAFSIIDGYDVDISSLVVNVDNHLALENNIFQSGYNGPSGAIYEVTDGYRIVIDPEEKFAYNAQITVTIDGYDFSGNHIDYEYYFYTVEDTDPPIVSGKSPDADQIEVAIKSSVVFEITDSVSGVDGERLDVHIDSVSAIADGVFQPGFSGASSGIETITDGYRVEIDPTGLYEFDYNQVHTVTVDGYDFANNHVHDDYYFATVTDPSAPSISNIDPAPDSDEASVATDITFDITDAVSGVDMNKLDVYVNGIPAISSGFITAPFADVNSGITTIADGYRIVLDLVVDFGYNELETVSIEAYDNADNKTDYSYSFRTKVDVNGPTVTPIDPLPSVGGYLRTTNIILQITDDETGVDLDSIDVVIDNDLAIEAGEFTPAFSGAYSGIIQLLDGYELVIDPVDIFNPSESVRVVVDGYDFANNQTHYEYVFTTRDDVGPYIFDFHPAPLSIDADVEPLNISFGIRDSGDGEVDLGTLVVEVSGDAGESYTTLYEPVEEFRSDWAGAITNQDDRDGYVFTATKLTPTDSFSVYTFRITASDNYENSATTVVGKDSEIVSSGEFGIISGFDRLDVGEAFIDENEIEVNDFIIIDGVGSFIIDGYNGDELVLNKHIAAGGTREFSVYRGTFMTERNLFIPSAEASSETTVDTTYTTPYTTIGTPATYTITGGDYPLDVVSVESFDDYTIRLTTDVPMQPLVEYTLYITQDDILDEFGIPIDDGYNIVTFLGYTDRIGPRVETALISPFNINVTVIFDDYMLQDEHLASVASYRFSHGAYATNVEHSPDALDKVVLTVENLYGREWFDLFVSSSLRDSFGNYLDARYNHAIVRFDNTTANFGGATGRLKTRDAVNRLYEDSSYWYIATEGGVDVVDKYSMENAGFVLDGYGTSAITATNDYIYFGSEDGYVGDAYQTGVYKLSFDNLSGNSTEHVVDAFAYPTIQSNHINDLFRATYAEDDVLVIATTLGATVAIGDKIVRYSSGNDIGSVYTNAAGTILYLANNTLQRVEVYYDIHEQDLDTNAPDAYYSADTSPEITGSYIYQIKVTNNTSIMDPYSNTIYVATDNGLTRIDTDESAPGSSEGGGISFSYGIEGSGATFEELGGKVNTTVAVDVNMQILQLFVLTNNDIGQGGLTTINIPSNTKFSYRSAEYGTLISTDLRDLTFKNL